MFEKEERTFFVIQFFSQYVPVGSSNGISATLSVFFAKKPRNVCSKSEKDGKNILFERDFFYKTIFWDDRMQFWQTHHFFTESLEMTKWVIDFQKTVPKIVPLDSQYAVKRTQIKIMAIVRNFFARSLKNKKEFF